MISSYGTALNHLCKEIGGNILRLYLIKKKEDYGAIQKVIHSLGHVVAFGKFTDFRMK